MQTHPGPSRAQAAMAHLIGSLAGAAAGEPLLAAAALRRRVATTYGPGPLGWVTGTAAACTDLLVEHSPYPALPVEALTRAHQEMLLCLLLTLGGQPWPARDDELSQPEIVRFVVEREIPLDAGVGMIRRAQGHFVERLLAHAAAQNARGDIQLSIVVVVTRWMDRYLDTQIRDYLAEQERVRRGSSAQRRRMLDDLLAGRLVDSVAVQETLAVDLHCYHRALVLTSHDHSPRGIDALELCAARAGRTLDPPVLLRHEPSRGVVWLWVSGPSASDAVDLLSEMVGNDRVRVRVGVGSPHQGPTGFRRTHLEAVDAERVARLYGRGPVVLHRDVALAVLLGRDPERARWFVDTHLRDLARPGEPATELRETLRCFYQSQMRLVTASAQLKVHRNTMIHRLRRIESLLGHPVGENTTEVSCALLILDLLADTEHGAYAPARFG